MTYKNSYKNEDVEEHKIFNINTNCGELVLRLHRCWMNSYEDNDHFKYKLMLPVEACLYEEFDFMFYVDSGELYHSESGGWADNYSGDFIEKNNIEPYIKNWISENKDYLNEEYNYYIDMVYEIMTNIVNAKIADVVSTISNLNEVVQKRDLLRMKL